MRAPVRSSLANRGAEPSRQARESVHFIKNEKKTVFVKKIKRSVQDIVCGIIVSLIQSGL